MVKTWAIALAGASLLWSAPGEPRELIVGKAMPPTELTLIDGSKMRLADLRGQVVVLNFWATWCVPCRTELPLLDAYYRRLQAKGLRVYAITTESSLPLYRLKSLFAAMAIPSVRRVKGISSDMAAVPTNYVIDRSGIVRHTKAGAFDLKDLNAILIPLLNEPPPA